MLVLGATFRLFIFPGPCILIFFQILQMTSFYSYETSAQPVTGVVFMIFKNNIIIIIILIIIITFIIELTHSKTILQNTVEIEPQLVALDFKNLSQYSSRSK